MKRFFLTVLILLLVISPSFAIYYSNILTNKSVTFISKYSSRSMDTQTLDYYEKISQRYGVYIIKDSLVASNDQSWKSAYKNSSIIFVISLSNETLNQTRDNFCRNLAVVLNESVGIVFAGNSLTYSGNQSSNTSGCLYTQYFNFTGGYNNTELVKNEVKIANQDEITAGYELKTYNLGEEKTVYPVMDPKTARVLVNVNEDPDGTGTLPPADYPLVVLWRGLKYNILSWGITTSNLSGCGNCLEWNLFNQALEWISDTKNMGFIVRIDRSEYFPSDRISIDAFSNVSMQNVSGKIIYPNSKSYDLAFFGSGNSWNSVYLLQDEDPAGEYKISVVADKLEFQTKISVRVMNINLNIDNSTEKVRVSIDLKDKYGKNLENSNIGVNLKRPSNIEERYNFTNSSSAVLVYNVTESGNYSVGVVASDSKGRIETAIKSFYFRLKPNITFMPNNITETFNDATNFTRTLTIFNKGSDILTNITPRKEGDIKDWVQIDTIPFSLNPGNSTILNLNISVPEIAEGVYTGFLNFTTDRGFNILPISINLDYLGELSVSPSSQTEWIPLEQAKEIELTLSNFGKGSLEIKSIIPDEQLSNWVYVQNKPSLIIPNGRAQARILISTEGVTITDVLKTVSGSIEITSDLGVYYPSPTLTINIISDIPKRVESFYPNIIETEKSIEELKEKVDVSGFEADVKKVREKIENTKELYENGQFESSYQMYNSIEPDISNLKNSIEKKKEQLKQNRERTIMSIIVFFAIIIVAIVGYIIYKKVKESGEYSWLYKKWKRT